MESPDASSLQQAASPGHTPGRVSILLPLPLAGCYDYAAPPSLSLAPGDFVSVPLGSRNVTGVVWGPGSDQINAARLKPVNGRLDAPPMPGDLRRFVDWVANYTISPPGAVLRMAMRVPAALEPARPVTAYRSGGTSPARMTPARRRVLDVLTEGPPRTASDLAREAGVTSGVIRGLADSGALEPVFLPRQAPFATPDPHMPGPQLSPEQDSTAQSLIAAVGAREYSATLMEGVTGAGKTEVYFEAIAETLRQGRQALILLPEIALTVQFLERFEARFGTRPGEWHSELSPPRRRHTWRAVAEGKVQVLVGARSALFLPFPDLGLIIVDEEHDPAFKQEESVAYHARDMAVVRAHIAQIPIVLSSATPSLETVVNAQAGRYRHLTLPRRHGGAELPTVEAVDMRESALPADKWLSPRLTGLIAETLERGEQVMLFLNRRGYAPLTLCRACGHRLECPNCAAWLVEHRFHGRVQCHHCGFEIARPDTCSACEAEDRLVPCGPGVERLAEEVAALFPDIAPSILSGDSARERGVANLRETIAAFAREEIPLLIGTQIIAKGHHFPGLTLVGVIDADLGLAGGDLRAAERTYQLLHQVAGRAGRGCRPGHVVLQTHMPEHPVMQALCSGDAGTFLAREAEARKSRHLPPFGRLIALVISGPDIRAVQETAATLARTAPHGQGVNVLGPAPAPLALLRGRHRQRLLLMAERQLDAQGLVRKWLARIKAPASVRIAIDVDPYSFL